MKENDSLIYVIFGASGDLTKRKLVPALYSLFVQDLLPEKFALLGVSRSEFTDVEFRNAMKLAIKEFKEIDDTSKINDFVARIYYQSIKFGDASSYVVLRNRPEQMRPGCDVCGYTIFYINSAKFIWNNSNSPGSCRSQYRG